MTFSKVTIVTTRHTRVFFLSAIAADLRVNCQNMFSSSRHVRDEVVCDYDSAVNLQKFILTISTNISMASAPGTRRWWPIILTFFRKSEESIGYCVTARQTLRILCAQAIIRCAHCTLS